MSRRSGTTGRRATRPWRGREVRQSLPPAFLLRCLALVWGAFAGWAAAVGWASSPNIVLVLTDDQGWIDTSVQMDPNVPGSRSDFYQTPRLEEMARQGMRFASGYSSSTICAPTRAAILTGASPEQLQIHDLPQALPPGSPRWDLYYTGFPLTPPLPSVLDPTGMTLPRMLKAANPDYRTAHFGKWHLAVPAQTDHLAAGYDAGGELLPIPSMTVDPWGVFELSRRAGNFMAESVQNDQPFFVQISHKSPHVPVQSRAEIRAKYEALPKGTVHKNVPYAAMVEDLDTSLGMVLDKIDELGIADNTYVFFMSDNGGHELVSSNGPLSHGKAWLTEGGIRVPWVVTGPGIAPGSVSHVPVESTDLFSTFADLAGFSGSLPTRVEGASLRPLFENNGQLPADMPYLDRNFHTGGALYWHYPMSVNVATRFRAKAASAVRDGDYKLIVEYGEGGAEDSVYLYNLATNLSESINLASALPEVTATLRTKLDNYLRAIDASMPYDLAKDLTIEWSAATLQAADAFWSSTQDLRDRTRERFDLGTDAARPQLAAAAPFQPGLPRQALQFDGNDGLSRMFFQVADVGPRTTVPPSAGTPNLDRSASLEMWVKLDTLAASHLLFETGDGEIGLSASLGDAQGDGRNNDLRFRILGLTGADDGVSEGVLQQQTLTVPIDRYADPVRDFVHLTMVFNDDPNHRSSQIYVNGALVGSVDGALGAQNSLRWDGFDLAGLGGKGGEGVGGNNGPGTLPFVGSGLRGELAMFRFHNFALDAADVQQNYNQAMTPTDRGIVAAFGQAAAPETRPVNVTLGQSEADLLQVMHERTDRLDADLPVDARLYADGTLSNLSPGEPGVLLAGSRISSYLLHFDPVGDASAAAQRIAGAIAFDHEILGILWEGGSLAATDALLGSLGNYGSEADRGLAFSPTDVLAISNNRRSLAFDLTLAADAMLQFRVITTGGLDSDFDRNSIVNDADFAVWQASFGVDDGGDADGDGDTDGADLLIWQQEFLSEFTLPESGDFNSSGVVNGSDVEVWESAFGQSIDADANGDGVTDGADLLAWQRHYAGIADTYALADFDANGVIDDRDLALWQTAYGPSSDAGPDHGRLTGGAELLAWQRHIGRRLTSALEVQAASVPEPAAALLGTLALLPLVGPRRQDRGHRGSA